MLIYIDESGIHKPSGTSTVVFVYIYSENASLLEQETQKIEENLKIGHFHWADFGSKKGWEIRERFLRKICHLPFSCKLGIARNPIHFPSIFSNCIEHLLIEKNIEKITIDGKKPKWYERKMKWILRNKGISVHKLRTASDSSCGVLRIADALAGFMRSHIEKPSRRTQILHRLLDKKITARLFPGGQKF